MNHHYLAQQLSVGGTNIKGPLVGINNIGDVINLATKILIPIAAVILIFVFISGGYDFLLSQGEGEKLNKGKGKMTAGVIGFVLLVLSYVIVRLIGYMFRLGGGGI